MTIREHIKDQHAVVTDEGEIEPDANYTDDSLPPPNERLTALRHPRRDYDAEIKAAEQMGTVHDIGDQRQYGVGLSRAEQDLKDALESQEEEVAALLKALKAYTEELTRLGLSEERIRQMRAKKFGRAIAGLANKGIDVEPIVGSEVSEPAQQADVHQLPIAQQESTKPEDESGESTREPDWRERQVGRDF